MKHIADRWLKWLLPALILINVSLVGLDWLEPGEAVLVVAGVEILALLVGIQRMLAAVRRFRRGRSLGLDAWKALEDGLTAVLPRYAARLVVFELRLPYYLAKWTLRRTGPEENEFSYHKRSIMGLLLPVALLVTPIETLLVELLIPWTWLRVVHLALVAYALLWVLGFYASLVSLPHRLEENGIRLRYGVLAEGFVPYRGIAGIERGRGGAPGGPGDGLRVADGVAHLAMGGHTDITLKLRSPLILQGFLRPTLPVESIHLSADDPGSMFRELERKLHTAASGERVIASDANG